MFQYNIAKKMQINEEVLVCWNGFLKIPGKK